MNEGDGEIPEERILFFDVQEVPLHDFEASGYILDIGGGGEGIIGRLKGEQVIAIDPSIRELEEAPSGPLKVVMDARDLQFLDSTFLTATAFFTLMYIKAADHERVLSEVLRALKPGGRFLIWEVVLPPRPEEGKERTSRRFPWQSICLTRSWKSRMGPCGLRGIKNSATTWRWRPRRGSRSLISGRRTTSSTWN